MSCTKLQLPPEPLNRGLPPPDPRSLCPLSSTEFVEPPTPIPRTEFLGTPLYHRTHQAQCTEWIVLDWIERTYHYIQEYIISLNDIIVTKVIHVFCYVKWFLLLFLSYIYVFVVGYWCVFSYFPMLTLKLTLWLLYHHINNNKLKWTKKTTTNRKSWHSANALELYSRATHLISFSAGTPGIPYRSPSRVSSDHSASSSTIPRPSGFGGL